MALPIIDESTMPPSRSPWAETWRLMCKNRMALTGLVIFVIFFGVAVAGLIVTSGTTSQITSYVVPNILLPGWTSTWESPLMLAVHSAVSI